MGTLVAITPTYLTGRTASEWSSAQRILAPYEIAINSDDGLQKRGDGVNTWANLLYSSPGGTPSQTPAQTIATTGNSDAYVTAPITGSLLSALFTGIDVLAAHDSNYITFSITNLGQGGAGSTAMLAATNANTTKATGGTALAANTVRALALNGTAANLLVTQGDRLRIRYAATGTLANTVTGSTALLNFV